jgi:hypothetical protein
MRVILSAMMVRRTYTIDNAMNTFFSLTGFIRRTQVAYIST